MLGPSHIWAAGAAIGCFCLFSIPTSGGLVTHRRALRSPRPEGPFIYFGIIMGSGLVLLSVFTVRGLELPDTAKQNFRLVDLLCTRCA